MGICDKLSGFTIGSTIEFVTYQVGVLPLSFGNPDSDRDGEISSKGTDDDDDRLHKLMDSF